MSLFNKLLALSALAGLLLPGPGAMLKDYVIFLLAASVLFSLLASRQEFRLSAKALKAGLIYNYGILTLALLVFSLFLPPGIREGVVLYAIFPPAVGMITLSSQWGGKPEDIFVFQLLSYVASLVFVPLAAYFFMGPGIDVSILVSYIAIAFIVPGAISLLVKVENKKLMNELSGIFLALVFYIVIAKSQGWIVENWQYVLGYSLAFGLLCHLLGLLALKITKDPDPVLYTIWKNGGAAAAASLAILPAAATAIISAKLVMDVLIILAYSTYWAGPKKGQPPQPAAAHFYTWNRK
ncbi:Uncharacterised protein [uncultured archaeon]|nr:Uncharacterised protein [uncultured archaeon]